MGVGNHPGLPFTLVVRVSTGTLSQELGVGGYFHT